MKNPKFIFEKNLNGPNWTAETLTAYFSFNPCPHAGLKMFESDTGGSETAMILDGKYYILNGDFRKQYVEAFNSGGMEACCALYAKESEEHGSTWTSGGDVMETFAGMIKRVLA